MKVILQRLTGDRNQTTGYLAIRDNKGNYRFINPCIERGYRDNERNVSNVPSGIYPIVFEYSPKFKTALWELKKVPNRSECKIHSANYWQQLNGCISPGSYMKYLNNDKYLDLAASRQSLNNFHRVMKREFLNKGIRETTIHIIDPILETPF